MDLHPIADDFQHGGLAQIGGLLSSLVSATPANLEINLDGKQQLTTTAHMLVTNMSYNEIKASRLFPTRICVEGHYPHDVFGDAVLDTI